MNYLRVIPRDLFNEANLLKCYGRLWIELETAGMPWLQMGHVGDPFEIQQNPDDGSLHIANVSLTIGKKPLFLYRPLNSRSAWPLYCWFGFDLEVAVFDNDGKLSEDFIAACKLTHEKNP